MSLKILGVPITSGFLLGVDIGALLMKSFIELYQKYQDSKKPKVCLDCPLIQNNKNKVRTKDLDGH
jgi:hypothetical protein